MGNGPLPHEIPHAEAVARGIAEHGVVTGRPRRKAETVDLDLLRFAATLNGPTQVALTSCDHYDPAMRGARTAARTTARVRDLVRQVEEATGAPVTLLDTGPLLEDVIDLS